MIFSDIIQFVTHLDSNLLSLSSQYGFWIYPILFIIIFCETGLVVTPFLPGDSLIFAAGTIASTGAINIFLIFIILLLAAVIGDSVNYSIGKYAGKKIIEKNYVKYSYVEKTRYFFEKYGNKTIVIARFMPIVRTFAPFVAGIGSMRYRKFLAYNILGAFLWVSLFVFAGFFFGTIPFVQAHFSVIILAIIFLSILPSVIEYIRYKFSR